MERKKIKFEKKICANPECKLEYTPTRAGQKYHSKECWKYCYNNIPAFDVRPEFPKTDEFLPSPTFSPFIEAALEDPPGVFSAPTAPAETQETSAAIPATPEQSGLWNPAEQISEPPANRNTSE
jgi:hypothetical protein